MFFLFPFKYFFVITPIFWSIDELGDYLLAFRAYEAAAEVTFELNEEGLLATKGSRILKRFFMG